MTRALLLAVFAVSCNAFMVQPSLTTSAVSATASMPAALSVLPRAEGVAMIFGASKKPKKAAAKKPKKVVKKPKKAVRGKPNAGQRGITEELGFIANFGLGAVKDYGGGNGNVIFTPTFAAAAAVWLFILFRFVLFYGAFGGD